jgi:hypothetical protein
MLRSVLVGHAGFAEDEAARAVDGVFANPRRLRERAESVATAAHATARLAEGARWWNTTGKPAKDRPLAGDGPGAVLIESWYVLEDEDRRTKVEASQAFG